MTFILSVIVNQGQVTMPQSPAPEHQVFGKLCVSCEHWPLLDEEQFRYTGPDWLLLLLDGCLEETRGLVKLLLWKTWSVHNNITHQAGPTSY